ncbi:class I SAM-dependent methyltransferase [Kineococcus rhizosphaerae]|uniref:Methyltransferase family protein n=1 Tax=Kineococcus rhizosphaerae TaxID=559628 RepID=A0A2T0R206_9ACTN|nr:class I SAM-dependent methyltransferase [Kineococcus rhizosphaerae]PRY13554.1 methyltransferase family protein [Kineococcus rhizosphaerae]
MTDQQSTPRTDGSAGDADYARIGTGYSTYRRPDPVIAAAVETALGTAETVLNVGAGAGSYEPAERRVSAVEPSATMRRQRPPHLSVAVDATAEHLPFDDGAFDAAMATFTVHQWPDLAAGLAEVRRVTRGPVLVLTCDPAALEASWLTRYAPEVIATEARRYPAIAAIERALTGPGAAGARVEVRAVDIPLGCVDGFSEAYYGRPELLLDPGARRANSAWSFVGPEVERRFEQTLRADLDSGAWDAEFGHLRRQPTFAGSLRLVVGHGPAGAGPS